MSSTSITLELPRNLFFTRDAHPVAVLVPCRLDGIVERNRRHELRSAVFAVATAGLAMLAALGIAGS